MCVSAQEHLFPYMEEESSAGGALSLEERSALNLKMRASRRAFVIEAFESEESPLHPFERDVERLMDLYRRPGGGTPRLFIPSPFDLV